MKKALRKAGSIALGLSLAALLAGCEGDDGNPGPAGPAGPAGPQGPQGDPAPTPAFTLQLLHFADVDGSGGADDVERFSALVNGFRDRFPENTVLVSSGDNLIPGPEFFAADDDALAGVLGEPGNGRANIAWLNAMGVQASAIGNHDLDASPDDLAELIAADGLWGGAQFPYLAANIDFSGSDLNNLVVADGAPARVRSVAASATVLAGGEVIGLVGASVPTLPTITNTSGLTITPAAFDPSVDADLDALAAAIQPAVDDLVAAGVDKIILLAHMQQIAIEQALASRLEDVDIIVAGGSNTILADGNDRLRDGDAAADTYPIISASPSGDPVLVVNTDGDFRYLGRLVVEFDDDGVLDTNSIDPAISGAYATDLVQFPFSPLDGVEDITLALESVLSERDGNVLGFTDVYLDGRRSEVRTEETNLGNLTADANLAVAQAFDPTVLISLKNGGGIRNEIGQALQPPGTNDPADIQFLPPPENTFKPAGAISQLDIETSLRFNNGLTLLTVTATELADIIEHAVAATAAGATPGRFPQVAGMRFSFDPAQPARVGTDTNGDTMTAGSRLRNLAVLDAAGAVVDQVVVDGAVAGDATRTFRLVILDFIAKCVGDPTEDCGDGYPLKGLAAPNRVDLEAQGLAAGATTFADAGSEQDALAEFLLANAADAANAFDTAETDPVDDTRIQNLGVAGKTDTVFP